MYFTHFCGSRIKKKGKLYEKLTFILGFRLVACQIGLQQIFVEKLRIVLIACVIHGNVAVHFANLYFSVIGFKYGILFNQSQSADRMDRRLPNNSSIYFLLY